MRRNVGLFLSFLAVAVSLLAPPALACVGKTLVIGADRTPRSRFVAQVLAILINERTGTTVKIAEFTDAEAVHRALASGEADIAVEYASRALSRLGLPAAADAEEALRAARAAYQEKLNLTWLPPLGFTDSGDGRAVAAPVARKDTLKKFPALPRLIAKTEGVLPDGLLATLAEKGDPARTAREFLRGKKLI